MDGIEQFLDDGLVGWDTQALEFAPSSVLVACLIGGWVVAQALEFAPTFFHLPSPDRLVWDAGSGVCSILFSPFFALSRDMLYDYFDTWRRPLLKG